MKPKIKNFYLLLMVVFAQIGFAQERTITGIVTDQSGLPLPGVSIMIKDSKVGTNSDFDGNFTIKAKPEHKLVFSFIGMKTMEVMASSTKLNIKMQDDAQELNEVVITSQGIKREKQALGYSVSEVKAADLEQRAEGDVMRVLSGKASGVVINQASGISGSATNVVIRGLNTITGSNQPLYIVDGVPFNSDTNAGGNFDDGNSGSSRFLDLDPNNIENINVLKGYAAANLYGTAGKNGVILITTKSGSAKKGAKKTDISVSQSVFTNEIASLPDYQNKFGNGFDQAFGNFFSNWGPGFYEGGIGSWNQPGSGIGSDGTYLHPYSKASLASVFPELQGVRLRWEAKPDNVKDFFRRGVVTNTSVNASSASDDGKKSFSFNFGHLDDEGFTPGNNLRRTSFSVGGRAELSNKFTVNGTMNFSRTDFLTPPVARSGGSGAEGAGLSIFGDIFYTPRNVDLQNWPFQHPITGANLSYRSANDIVNPYWTLNNSFAKQITNRVFGQASLMYNVTDKINVVWRTGYDFYNERNEIGTNKGAPSGPVLGEYRTFDNNNLIYDHTLMVNGMHQINDEIGLSFNVGGTARHENYDRQGVRSENQDIFGIYRHFNFSTQSPIQFSEKRNITGLFAQTELDYKRFAYVTLAGRQDWVSNTFDNSLFYPSISASFIPTKVFDITTHKGLNFLKVRVGHGNSAGFATGYPVANTINAIPRNFSDISGVVYSSQEVSSVLGNPNLKPELYTENEFGVESKFFANRFSVDLSYFRRKTEDLITQNPIPNSTGFATTFTNIGLIEGDGIEIDLGLHIIKNDNDGFNWEANTNFTSSKSIVKDLGGANNLTIAGFTNLGNQAIVGEQLGVIVGNRVKRDENGNKVVGSNGNYIIEEGNFIIGNPNPDFILNTTNTFTYKNFNFNFLLSYTKGGDVYSQTIAALMGRGLTTDTENRLGTYILPGVKENGEVNDIQINNSSFYFSNIGFGAAELKVYDGSVIRLQEISLGYNMPSKWLEKTPFGNLSFNLSGNNLYYNAFNTPKGVNFDPNVIGTGVGNGRGFDFLNGPSAKRYGFSIKATF